MEKTFWTKAAAGNAPSFYARHMTADGFVALPTRILSRDELVSRCSDVESVQAHELSDPTFTLLEGANVMITYHVTADAAWLPTHKAYPTALYSWQEGSWSLVFRFQTPESSSAF